MTSSTSFRISATAKAALAARAQSDGMSATALLEQLITEGVRTLDHPGIVFRGLAHSRRAALAGGPDVWELVARLRELDGPVERRVQELSDEAGLPAQVVRVALDYAAAHPDEVESRIRSNEEMIERSQRLAAQRAALLA